MVSSTEMQTCTLEKKHGHIMALENDDVNIWLQIISQHVSSGCSDSFNDHDQFRL